MRTVCYRSDIAAGAYSRGLFRPTQQSAEGWKARTSIHSFSDVPSPADADTTSLPIYLCYACQTTLTSKSSRSTKTLDPGTSGTTSAPSAVNLPTWAAARLAFGIGDTTSTSSNEIRETQKLDSGQMKSLVGEFLLDH